MRLSQYNGRDQWSVAEPLSRFGEIPMHFGYQWYCTEPRTGSILTSVTAFWGTVSAIQPGETPELAADNCLGCLVDLMRFISGTAPVAIRQHMVDLIDCSAIHRAGTGLENECKIHVTPPDVA